MCSSTDPSMADAQKTRRSNKPLMERRRRERINHCLNELKNLVLTAQKKDPTRYSKLEKADILEMTVRHVQALHRQEPPSPSSSSCRADPSAKYRAGYTQCAAEVSRFLAGVSGLPSDLHARVLDHLSSSSSSSASPEPAAVKPEGEVQLRGRSPQQKQEEKEAAPLTGVPLVQARLSSGQLALVLPSWTAAAAAAAASGDGSPANAASGEAAGAPSSPESARGSPREGPSPDACPVGAPPPPPPPPSTLLQPLLGPGSPSLAPMGQRAAPQVAPLDLATPHRRGGPLGPTACRQRALVAARPSEGVDGGPPEGGQRQGLREGRHAPYPAHHHRHHHSHHHHHRHHHHHHHQNPHWRPW